MRILLVDSDRYNLDLLTYLLTREGHSVVTAQDGQQALAYWRAEKPDLVISEVDLPKLSGYELCEAVRNGTTTPFILFSQRQSDEDVLKGFAAGADDYIPKPFSPRILLARIAAVTRRAGTPAPVTTREKLVVGDLTLDPERLEVMGPEGRVPLPSTEFEVLYVLAVNKGAVLTEGKLAELVWGSDDEKKGLVKTHIHHLRQKIEPDPANPRYLVTVPGVGYVFTTLRPSSPTLQGRLLGKRLSLQEEEKSGEDKPTP